MNTHWLAWPRTSLILLLAVSLFACGGGPPVTADNEPVQVEEEEPTDEVAPDPTATDTPRPQPTNTATVTPVADTPTATYTPTFTPEPLPGWAEAAGAWVGALGGRTRSILDLAGHFNFILLPEQPTLQVEYTLDLEGLSGSMLITGTENAQNWVPVLGDYLSAATGQSQVSATDFRGLFEATGSGTVAGFPDVTVKMTGVLSEFGLEGFLRYGAAGELPQGRSILYHVTGEWATPFEATPGDPTGGLPEFLGRYIEIYQAGDAAAKLAITDPFTLAIYGVDQCVSYLADRPADPTFNIVMTSDPSVGPGQLAWDNFSIDFDNIVQVPVDYTVGGATTPTILYFRYIGNQLYRQLDCGDPLN